MESSICVEYECGGRANLGEIAKARKSVTSRPKILAKKEDTPGQVRRYNSAGEADNN
jgi:hypothetical protein